MSKPARANLVVVPKGGRDINTIRLPGFTLHATGVEVVGRPSFADYQGAQSFATRAHKAAGWWVADLARYADTRDDWAARRAQLAEASGYSERTVENLKYLAENVASARRRADVGITQHFEVMRLQPKEQEFWLDRAATEGLTQTELRREIRAAERRRVIDGQAVLSGMYRVIYADPPWAYGNSSAQGGPGGSSYGAADRHYPEMSIEDLCQLPVKAHALEDAILFMWITSPLLLQNPGPREVLEAWGFTYKSSFVWDKVLGNFGHYNHVQHEFLVICTRGSCLPDVPTPQPKSVYTERRSSTHSEKPEGMRKIIEKHWTQGPYLELFGRTPVDGWSVFGNDARLWAEQRAVETRRA